MAPEARKGPPVEREEELEKTASGLVQRGRIPESIYIQYICSEPPWQASFHGSKVSNKGTRINSDHKKRGVSDSTPRSVEVKIHKVPNGISSELIDLGQDFSALV